MKKTSEIISCPDFLELLKENKGTMTDSTRIIQGGFLTINGKDFDSLSTLHFEGLTFTEMVTIRDFNKKNSMAMILHSSNFLGGLCIEGNIIRHISISSAKTKWVHLWRCKLEEAFLSGIEAEGIDVSGLELSEGLTLDECTFSELELIHSTSCYTIKTPRVKTDDPLVAEQFRLIGIPVFMSTEAVRTMMQNKAAGRRAAA